LAADDLDGAGEFLEMAATLVHIKAQMLLPRPTDEEDDDPRAELVRRLLEYEQVREVTERLRSAEGQRARRFGKGYVPVRRTPPVSEEPLRTTWEEVWDAALGVEMPERGRREHHVTPRTVSMEEKAALILDVLRSEAGVRFHHLLRGFEERMHGVMTLLAGLELTRRRLLILRQSRPFTELWIYRSDREGAWEEPGAPPEPGATADETPSTREGAEG